MADIGVEGRPSSADEKTPGALVRFDRVRATYVAVIYASVSLVYILISDLILYRSGDEHWTTMAIAVGKGFAFVIASSILIYLLIRWNDRKRLELQNRICDLNEMMNQKEIVSQMARLESIGRLAAGLAHNLNNGLAVIEGNADMIGQKNKDPEIARNLKAIKTSVARGRDLSNTLLGFSEGGEPIKDLTEPGQFISELATSFLKGSAIKLSLDLPRELPTVLADLGQLKHAYVNLLKNSQEAMPEGGSVTIVGRSIQLGEGEVADLPAGEYVKIEVRDTGPGMSEEVLERIFDPYFSTKGQNRGLGLPLAQSVIRRHGGVLIAESLKGSGAVFTTYLPVHRFLPDQDVKVERRKVRTKKVLWMDDEGGIREIGKELLEHLGYDATIASDGEEALREYRKALDSQPFDAVILDLVVPKGMGGAETMERLLAIDPEVRAVVCSGYSNDPVMAHHLEHGFMAVLPKPFNVDHLQKVLRSVLE
jgi:signal transduction histidine kinase/ActR/RegA family two-component response regulator